MIDVYFIALVTMDLSTLFSSEQLQRQINGWIKGYVPHKKEFFFYQIPCKFHICYLDSLFMSANIFCTAYVGLKDKVKINGATRENTVVCQYLSYNRKTPRN